VAGHPFETGFDLTLRPERLKQPLAWKRPRTIFVNSMSDLFHKDVPRAFIDQVFDTMEHADWHIFQVLAKRSSLLSRYLRSRYGAGRVPAHIWCGVSIEDAQAKSRLAHLRAAPATTRFLSLEPLLGSLGRLDLAGIDWVIVGGESGPGARVMEAEWVRSIRDQCFGQGVAFFCNGAVFDQRAVEERWTTVNGMNIRISASSSQRRSRRTLLVRETDRGELGPGGPYGGKAQNSQRVFAGMVPDRWSKPKLRPSYLYRRLRRAGTL
jgi:protein gp37